jgi:hypothetical protein
MDLVPFRIASLLTGLTMAGEALALLVGMHILSAVDNPWISVKNDLFLALDIVAGLGLLYHAWEYLARASNPFWPTCRYSSSTISNLLACCSSPSSVHGWFYLWRGE